MIILGIETSCDETAAAVLEQKNGRIQILSNVVSSSASLQVKYGGILPEQAAREQVKMIIPVIEESLQAAGVRQQDINAIAITQGPGLIGSLLVGVETAKVLAKVWGKPLIPINHLLGHFYANWINTGESETAIPEFPAIGLLTSGGHTDLVYFKNHHDYEYIGGTRDDAAGECFDKCARLLGFPYPGGPKISELANRGDPKAFDLPSPMINSKDFDFSFSGLKTAFANLVHSSKFEVGSKDNKSTNYELITHNLCASLQQSIVDVLVTKTVQAVKKYSVNQVIVAGGVSANKKLREDLRIKIYDLGKDIKLHIPPPVLCTDNGAMIAARAFFEKPIKDPLDLQADPSLSLER